MRLIDADAFIQMMEEKYNHAVLLDQFVLIACRNGIAAMPTIEPKKGKWKDSVLGMDGYYANCSECGYQIDVHENRGYPNYCEYCGADMKGSVERRTDD